MLYFNGKKYFVPLFITSHNTLGADATPDKVIAGVKFVGANGVVETGTMHIYEDGSAYLYENGMDDEGNFYWGCYFESNAIIPEGESNFKIPASEFGDAHPMYVVEGHTFTSEQGICIEGTMPLVTGVIKGDIANETQEEYVFRSTLEKKTAFNETVELAVSKSDFGDAPASMVPVGYTFTSEHGIKVDGKLPYYDKEHLEPDEVTSYDNKYLYSHVPMTPCIVETGVGTKTPLNVFGDVPRKYVLKGETFTSKDGYLAEGTMRIYDLEHLIAERNENIDSDTGFGFYVYPGYNDYFVSDEVYFEVPKAILGDVDEWHVAEGYTFTSANGVKVTGKIPVYDYTPIEAGYSDETDEGFIFMGSVNSGALMEDEINLEVPKEQFGDAEAAHVLKDKTFTSADGFNATGTLEKYDGSQLEGLTAGADENNVIVVTHFEDPNYVEGDSYVYSNVPLEGFGNATASDVRVGKTFTSSAGLKEDGTMPNVGVPAPTFTAQLDDDDDSGNTVWLRASVSQSAGYTAGGNKSTEIFPKLTVSGDTATMECGGVSISRKVGASIATCNVTVNFTTNPGTTLISATTFANGAISVYNSSASSGTITIPNVVCGSALSINTQKMVSLYTSASQQPHNTLLGGTVKVPATAGQTYTIDVGTIDD